MPLPLYKEKIERQFSTSPRVVAIAAGKGGVGKSTVAVNLARSFVSKGYKVGVLDADIYGPSLRRMLPEDRLPSQRGDKISPALSGGISYISMAYFRKENEAAVVRAPVANGLIQQFLSGVDWGDLDYLFIDFPPGTGDIQLTLAQKAYLSGALLVTTPQEVALMDVRKAAAMFEQVKIPLFGLLENMSYYSQASEKVFLFGKEGGRRLCRELGIPLLGEIPIDSAISESGDTGIALKSDSESAMAFASAADALIKQISHLSGSPEDVLEIESYQVFSGEKLQVRWKKHGTQYWSAEQLLQHCPCAACVEPTKRNRQDPVDKKGPKPVIRSVNRIGRYAIQIDFIYGCSAGIFDFDYLNRIPGQIEAEV